jgi:hypothetical protein
MPPRAMAAWKRDNDQAPGACFAGVKVRITRQRMVGRIARHSGADIAAGVTTGRPWLFVIVSPKRLPAG